jgi:hypothetical protein
MDWSGLVMPLWVILTFHYGRYTDNRSPLSNFFHTSCFKTWKLHAKKSNVIWFCLTPVYTEPEHLLFPVHLHGEFRLATFYNLNSQVTLTSLACVSFSDPKWSWRLVWHGTSSSVLHLQECTSHGCPTAGTEWSRHSNWNPTTLYTHN